MQKYMSHPKHGGMLVFMDDFEQKQKEGWVFGEALKIEEKSLDDGKARAYANFSSDSVVPMSLQIAYENKFGKKPHHLMKQENIKKALE